MDELKLSDLSFWAYHGVLESEQSQGQRFVVDCAYTLDTTHCADDVSNTVNYAALADELVAFCQNKRYRLIETLVNKLAAHLLFCFPLIRSLTLTLHKPQAPISLSFSDVTITVTRAWQTCYLGLGSNLGAREVYLDSVQSAVNESPAMRLLSTSTYQETAPYGVTDQPHFLNAVLKIETFFSPMQLLDFTQNLEQAAGRVKVRHWGERTLDVDILLYEDLILNTQQLCLPHPQMHLRDFVLAPLCELSPHLLHPVYRQTMMQLRQALQEEVTR